MLTSLICFFFSTGYKSQILWSSAGGSAWLTGGNWTGGSVPGSTQVAQFGLNPTAASGAGINYNNTTNNGTQNQICGAIEIASTRTNNVFLVGNSSTSAGKNGTLTLSGRTVNSVANVILRNASNRDFTIQNTQGSGNQNMCIALANSTNNVINLDGTANIVISCSIISLSSGSLTIGGTGSGRVDITNSANTFTAPISITGSEVRFSSNGCLGNTNNIVTIDGGRFATANSTSFTLASSHSINVGQSANTSISTPGTGTLTYSGIISDKGLSTGSWAKQGTGVLQLGGVSLYTGSTSINNGTVQLITGNNRLPVTSVLALGQSASGNLGALDLNGFNQEVAGLNSTTGTNATANNNLITSATTATLTISNSVNQSFGDGSDANSGVISGSISVLKKGSGVQTLGDINTYTGFTNISTGELRFSPNGNENLANSAVVLNGGTLGTNGIANAAVLSFSTLNLSDNSLISLGSSNAHTLAFVSSNLVSWTSAKTLTITGWQGTYTSSTGSSGTVGKIFVGNSSSALTGAQLAQIKFYNGTNYFGALLLNNGELVPYCIAPQVSSINNNSPVCERASLIFSVAATGTSSPTFTWSGPSAFASNLQNPTITTVAQAASGIYTLSVSNGCGSLTSTISVVVNTAQVSSVWNGNQSDDWFNPDNWSNCVCGGVTNATIAAAALNQPVINSTVTAQVNNITVEANATLSISGTETLNVFGNWLNNGNFTGQQSQLNFSGNSLQTIGGTSGNTFNHVTINNTVGVVLSAGLNLEGYLQLNSGTLTTNNLLTLKATSLSTGKIGPINSSADITGQVTIQQIAPGGLTGWAFLGAPISSSLTMADWNDDFAITCSLCPNGFNGNFSSIYSYDETAAGSYSAGGKYVPISNITNAITLGKGYWVYLGNGYTNTTDITFDVTGTIAKSNLSNVTIPLSVTNNNGATDDGWNLISNPLPCPISWTSLRNGNSNVDNAIYVYNADLGTTTSYVNGISSHTSNGVGDNIPMCQAFYVHATAPTTLIAPESVKLNSNPVFLKPAASTIPVLRLRLTGQGNKSDMTTFYFDNNGTSAFQPEYDAYKFIDDPSLPYIGGVCGNILTSINALPSLNNNMIIPIKTGVPATGNYTFNLLKSDFPYGICVKLTDTYFGTTTDLQTNSYICTLYDTTTTSRFILNIGTTPGSGWSNSKQPDCAGACQGNFVAGDSGPGQWNYKWMNAQGSVVKNTINKNGPDSLIGLCSGLYSVEINKVGTCSRNTQSVLISPVILPKAAFYTRDSVTFLSKSGAVNFVNNSINAVNYNWTFGNGDGSAQANPLYNYTITGVYLVKLYTESSTNCIDSTAKLIAVIDDYASVENLEKKFTEILLTKLSSGNYRLNSNLPLPEPINLALMDSFGREIKTINNTDLVNNDYQLKVEDLTFGVYFIKLCHNSEVIKVFKVFID